MTDNNEPSEQAEDLSRSMTLLMKCLIPSIIGFVVFLVPVNIEGKNNIPLAYIANKAVDVLGGSVNWILLAVVVIILLWKNVTDDAVGLTLLISVFLIGSAVALDTTAPDHPG